MPDLAVAELSIPAEQNPDPAKALVVPVDSTVVASTRRFIPWSAVGNPAFLNLPPPPPGMQASWVQIPQWAAISGLLPFCEPDPAAAIYFDRLSVLRFSPVVLAASWRRVLGSLSDLGVFGTVHVDKDAFRTARLGTALPPNPRARALFAVGRFGVFRGDRIRTLGTGAVCRQRPSTSCST